MEGGRGGEGGTAEKELEAWKAEAVMAWLASMRSDARRLAAVEAMVAEGLDDGVHAVCYDRMRTTAHTAPDAMAERVARHDEQAAALVAERDELRSRMKAAAYVVARAGRDAGMPKEAEFTIRVYIFGEDPAKTASAMGAGRWTAKAWPRRLAPAVFDRNPRRFAQT